MKRPVALNAAQLAFTFDAPPPAKAEGALAGLDRLIAGAVSQVLKEDMRSRAEIAGAMSALLSDDGISPQMLYAYAAPGKTDHNISFCRALALIAVTERFDILDAVLTRIGARVLVGQEFLTAELGHIDREMAALQERKKQLQAVAQPIQRGRS